MVDAKKLFDVIREIKGGPLTQVEVEKVNAILYEAAQPLPSTITAKPEPKRKDISDFIRGFIETHEGGLSMDPDDNGNWTGGKKGVGKLVGSKFGTTAGAIAAYRGIPAASITAEDVDSLTIDEAVSIGILLYYQKPKFDLLPFNRVTLSILDMGWGTGPAQAIKLMQRMVGVSDDGVLGPASAAAFTAWLARQGEEAAARAWGNVRNAFYDLIIQRNPTNAKYRNGWRNRTASFLPGTQWWKEWA